MYPTKNISERKQTLRRKNFCVIKHSKLGNSTGISQTLENVYLSSWFKCLATTDLSRSKEKTVGSKPMFQWKKCS